MPAGRPESILRTAGGSRLRRGTSGTTTPASNRITRTSITRWGSGAGELRSRIREALYRAVDPMARSGCDRDVHVVAYGRGLDGDSRDVDALLRRRLLLLCAVAQEVNAFVKTPPLAHRDEIWFNTLIQPQGSA